MNRVTKSIKLKSQIMVSSIYFKRFTKSLMKSHQQTLNIWIAQLQNPRSIFKEFGLFNSLGRWVLLFQFLLL